MKNGGSFRSRSNKKISTSQTRNREVYQSFDPNIFKSDKELNSINRLSGGIERVSSTF